MILPWSALENVMASVDLAVVDLRSVSVPCALHDMNSFPKYWHDSKCLLSFLFRIRQQGSVQSLTLSDRP